MDWLELFGSAEYDFPLEVEAGSEFVGGENYPDAIVTASDLLYPRRILIQRLDLAAEDRSTDRKERIRVYRVAIETEDGDLVELRRIAVPGGEISNVDISKCAGCGGRIPEGQHVVIDGLAYHRRCVEDSDDDTSDPSWDDAGRAVPDGSGNGYSGSHREGDQAEGAGASPATTPETVTKTHRDDGLSVSHLVTITKLDADREIVTLWCREFGSLSGTASGRWSTGLFHGELPTKTDTSYIDEKFFERADVVTVSDLRVWNRLYREALHELRQSPR